MDQNPKMWFMSRGIVGSVVAMLAGVVTLLGYSWDATTQEQLVTLAIGLANVVGGAVAWYGRAFAAAPIAKGIISRDITARSPAIITIAAVMLTALFLTGCASMLQFTADTLKVDVVSESAKQKAYKAALVTFVAWGGAPSEECLTGALPPDQCVGGIQKLIYTYGKLAPCGTTRALVCRNDQVWAKIKAIELSTTHTLEASRPLVAADGDVATLLALPEVVHDAHVAITTAMKE